MTDPNVVSLKAITPPRWEGELTTGLLDMYVTGLMNTNHEVGRRLAYELREAWETMNPKAGADAASRLPSSHVTSSDEWAADDDAHMDGHARMILGASHE